MLSFITRCAIIASLLLAAAPLQALGLNGNETINAAIVGNESGAAGPVILLPRIDLSTGALIPEPVTLAPTPLLALAGVALLVVLSAAMLAQNLRFVADGLIGDWAGYAPAASNPPGGGSPLTDIRQVFVAPRTRACSCAWTSPKSRRRNRIARTRASAPWPAVTASS